MQKMCLKISLRQSRSSLASWQSTLWSQKKFLLIQTPLSQGSWPSGHSAKINQLHWIANKGGRSTGRSFVSVRLNGTKRQCARLSNNNYSTGDGHSWRFSVRSSRSRRIPSYESAGKKLRTTINVLPRNPSPLHEEIRRARLTKCLR